MQPLDGTFLQLLQDHGNWTDQRWNSLFSDLKSIGLHKVIVQWSVSDDVSFYPSTTFATVHGAPLEKVLGLADKAQMEVVVGLVHDSTYWSQIKKDPAERKQYLETIRSKSLTAASELVPMLRRHSSVRGWYIPEEIDDVSWRQREAKAVLVEHVASLSTALKQKMPAFSVCISAFSQAQTSPEGFQQFWDDLLQHTRLDCVLYQDGIGAGKLDFDGLPVYLDAIHSAVEKNRRQLGVVVELFQQTAGPPLDDSKFHAVPASIKRVSCQLEMDGKYTSGELIAFSMPEYMTTAAGEAAGKLLADYRRAIADRSVSCDLH